MTVRNYSIKEVLDDGRPVLVRAIQPEDKMALRNGFERLSFESVYARFFQRKRELSAQELKDLTEIDFVKKVVIGVGLLPEDNLIPIGVGRYVVDEADPTSAEFALTVVDDFQGLGVGSLLLKHLTQIARDSGIEHLHATMLATNEKMLHLLKRSRLPVRRSSDGDLIRLVIDLKSAPSFDPR